MNMRYWLVMTGLLVMALQAGGQTPQLIRGPYLQAATSTGIVIRWRTDVITRSRVHYGTAPGKLDKVAEDAALTNEHSISLTGLQPHTQYYYSVENYTKVLQAGADNYFYTLPPTGSTGFYRVGVFGDCGNNSVNQRSVKQQFIKYLGPNYMDAWILLGDNAYSTGADAEFQAKFFDIYKDDLLKKYPLYPSPGNHDYNDKDFAGDTAEDTHQVPYFQNFTMPVNGEAGGVPSHNKAFYSFNIGNIHFLSLDSDGKEKNQYHLYDTLGPQVEWIKQDLAANKDKGWVVAYWHHPPYTMGSHSSDTEDDLVAIRENFIRILERYGVDVVLCGHSHDYERSRLIKGHYGMEATFNAAAHNLSNASGLYDGSPNSCPYIKDSTNQGTVYVVAGSAGQLGGKQKSFPHNAMFYSNADIGGAGMLEVQGNRLDFKWVCSDGVIRDHFTMMKEVNKHTVIKVKKGSSVTLTASFTGSYKWSNGQTGSSIVVTPKKHVTVYTVTDNEGCIRDTFTVETVKHG